MLLIGFFAYQVCGSRRSSILRVLPKELPCEFVGSLMYLHVKIVLDGAGVEISNTNAVPPSPT